MHKYVIISLLLICCILSGAYFWQRKSFLNEKAALNAKLAESEKLVQETKNSWSSRGLEIENLKTDNKELQKVIKAKKEEILAISDLALQWKNKYFQIKDAKQSVVDSAGSQPASISTECAACLASLRLKVDFEQVKDGLRVSGYTLSNPAEAYVNLEWIDTLKLQLVLTRGEEGSYRVYIESKNNDVVPVNLTLRVDPSILQKRWYEKINFTASGAFGNSVIGAINWGGMASLGVGYLITHNVNIGLNVSVVYASNLYMFYGVGVTWYPFLRK